VIFLGQICPPQFTNLSEGVMSRHYCTQISAIAATDCYINLLVDISEDGTPFLGQIICMHVMIA